MSGATIKPEIYATIKLTKGEVNLKPEIYATIIIAPKFERVHADTCRVIKKSVSTNSDTLRQIGKFENATVDTCKNIVRSERIIGDTKRKVVKFELTQADTFRVLFIPAGTYFKPFIWATIKATPHHSLARADTIRQLAIRDKSPADTIKRCGVLQARSVDTHKIIGNKQITSADTVVAIALCENTVADTLIQKLVLKKILVDTLRQIVYFKSITADTLIQIVDRATADTCRKIIRVEKSVADTIIRVPHILKYVIENHLVLNQSLLRTSPPSLVNSFKDYGIASFSVSLNERTLSDNFQLETTRQMDINEAVSGQLLDYPFSFLVEETSQQDLLQSVKGMYDVDKLLYSHIFFSENTSKNTVDYNEEISVTAAGYIQQIARYLGLNSNVKIEDFTPYHDFTGSNITYSDLLNTIFGWTSQLPQRQINVFIRGETLHCIQRGLEEKTFDITDLPHSRPKIDRQLIRSMWNNPFAKNDTRADNSEPFTGTISYSSPETTLEIRYQNGLLISENCIQQDGHKYTSGGLKSTSISQKNYSYISVQGSDNYYLSTQTISNESTKYDGEDQTATVETIETEYHYKPVGNDNSGEIYLFEEIETTHKVEYELSNGVRETVDSSESVRKTFHLPVGNGWYVQNVFIDGDFQGSNLSQGKPGNSVSLYTIQRANRSFGSSKNEDNSYEAQRNRLSSIVDTSFPVVELSLLGTLTDALLWLNRKIQEEISVDLISKIDNGVPAINHIVDFTERILLDGNEYYLVSNSIELTPRKFIQRLTLVRWYAQ